MSLLIFDGNISIQDNSRISPREEKAIVLFPLTGKQHILNQVVNKCYAEGAKSIEIINTGQIIDETAEGIRDKYLEFIAGLPDKFRMDGKNLKEWLYYPDGGISLWWLSLVAEKNTFKSDSFNILVQLCSVIRVIEEHKVRKIALSCSSQKLESALDLYCKENSLSFTSLPNKRDRGISALLDKYPAIRALAGASLSLVTQLMRWIYLKCLIRRNLKSRIGANKNNPLLFITYYPHIDTESASKGIFKNRYCLPLQDELEKQGRPIIWVAMYANSPGMSFRDSLRYAKRFIANGYHFVFFEEFMTVASFARVLRGLLWSVIRFKKIERVLPDYHYFDQKAPIYPILRKDWCRSFYGSSCVHGLLSLEAFKNMFKKLEGIRKGVYYCEMHAWEKALLAAKKMYANEMELFAYQHAAVSRMLLNYFNHPSELQEDNSKYAMPRPDKIACDGEITHGYFKESGWREDELTVVEAIRYSHLRDIVQCETKVKDNVILVAFSISIQESAAILNTVYEGLRDTTDIKVWLKPHPFLRMDLVFKKSGISPGDVQFEIRGGQIERLLPDVKGVIISESGVALEALAYGCKIISINLPDMINMSPLRGIQSSWIRHVNSADELREAVNELVREDKENNREDIKELINQFFYFGKTSAKPERFLELLS